jgi:hypothetical protein
MWRGRWCGSCMCATAAESYHQFLVAVSDWAAPPEADNIIPIIVEAEISRSRRKWV